MRVLLVVADSVRADALGCYGGALRTPTVDGLAASGARFETVISSAPWTLPSLAAMLTGVWSHRLGLLKWEQPWPREVPTLFDAFRAKGVETGSFVFDPDHLFRACPEATVVGSSQDTDVVLGWLRERRHRDYFALVHYWWTHVPYVGKKLPLATWNQVCRQFLDHLSAPDPEQRLVHREQIQGLYGLAVEELSEKWLGPLLDAANADVVVLLSDHGESWGERLPAHERLHDVFDLHGNHLHDEVIRVPWILHAPGLVSPVEVAGLARTVDLLPTLAELLDLELPAAAGSIARSGRSLVPALRSGRIADRDVALSARNWDFVDAETLPATPSEVYVELAAQGGATKVIAEVGSGAAREYDLRADPGELRPFAPTGVVSAPLVELLRREIGAAVVAPHDPEDLALMNRQLRSLGYL